MTESEIPLLPCPFCGAQPKPSLVDQETYLYVVKCPCGVTTGRWGAVEAAAKAWNQRGQWRRAPPDRPGWWWRMRIDGDSAGAPYIGEVTRSDVEHNQWKESLWSGPIEPPSI